MHKIWIIEDDFALRNELFKLLTSYGYDCSYSNDFKNVVQNVLDANVDLILLDINLPYYDGYHVCRKIRESSSIPIIVVTSRNNDIDELMSMNLGADDFITKPYNAQILLAHIDAVLKRTGHNHVSEEIQYQGIVLNVSKSILLYGGIQIELTKNELKILFTLFKNGGSIVSRNDIMNELWQTDEFVDDNTLTVNINRLRKKLEEIGLKDFIKTKRGQGYMV